MTTDEKGTGMTDIGKLPTQKQIEWLFENREDILRNVWRVSSYVLGEIMAKPQSLRRADYLAIMHKVTEAADQHIGPVIGNAKNGDWWHPNDNSGRNGHAASYPTRFQAELAALGAPEEVVNDG